MRKSILTLGIAAVLTGVLATCSMAYAADDELAQIQESGRALAKDPKNIPDEIYTELKEEFTEEEIVVITAMGVLMVANNYFNDILKLEV